jgi:hypothetical protein
MPSARVAKVLELAALLTDDERAELADRLWSTEPGLLSDDWTAEIRGRVDEMNAAEAGGEPRVSR